MMNAQDDPIRSFRDIWPQVRDTPGGIVWWLRKQHTGELEAIASMEALLKTFDNEPRSEKLRRLVEKVISDERNHVAVIASLLEARGTTPDALASVEILSGLDQWGAGCAATSRAEAIRAGEIRTVIADPLTPPDIVGAFERILREETFHEKAFRELAGPEEMARNTAFQGWGTGGGACHTRVCSEHREPKD